MIGTIDVNKRWWETDMGTNIDHESQTYDDRWWLRWWELPWLNHMYFNHIKSYLVPVHEISAM
jgi:hypothetical protein